MIPADLMPTFAKNYLLCGLPDRVIPELAEMAELGACESGASLVEKGQKGSDLYVILSGRLQVLSPQGDKLADVEPGSMVGEVALVDDQPRSADVVAIGLTKFARLPAAELRRYMAQNREVGFVMLANLARVLSMRLRNASIVLEDLKEKASQDPWRYAL
ncbi:MAG: cyclic nucleotide-binding domain-containing protein [Armatimonadetes bacterium]|nr:cyclic nucleotide-binding domain-containing protein [Armatimonadota bacterium]